MEELPAFTAPWRTALPDVDRQAAAPAPAPSAASATGMPSLAVGMGLDADAEFLQMQLDFLDSQSSLALEDFQREWERARYGENRLAVANNRVPKKVHILLSKRPKEEEEAVVEADGDDDDAFVREANKRAAPSRPEFPGDLSAYAPPPRDAATALSAFSEQYCNSHHGATAATAAAAWNALSEAEKAPYVAIAEADKVRATTEVAAYKAANRLNSQEEYDLLVQAFRDKGQPLVKIEANQ